MIAEADIAPLAAKVQAALRAFYDERGAPTNDRKVENIWARDPVERMLHDLQDCLEAAKVAPIGDEESILAKLGQWTEAATWYAGAQLRAETRPGGITQAAGKLVEDLFRAIEAALLFRSAVTPYCSEPQKPVAVASLPFLPVRPKAPADRMWFAAEVFRARGVRLAGLLRRALALLVLDDTTGRPGQSAEAARQWRRRRAINLGFAETFTVRAMQSDIETLRSRGLLKSRDPSRKEIEAALSAYIAQKLIEDAT